MMNKMGFESKCKFKCSKFKCNSFVIFFLLLVSFNFSLTVNSKVLQRGYSQPVNYKIPVTNPDLEPFANYKFDLKWKSEIPGKRVIEYDLPVELDGVGQDIEMRETTPNYFVGLHATAECVDTPVFSCTVHYRDVNKNPEVAQQVANAAILSKYQDTTFQQGRMAVAKSFIFDPEPDGILTVEVTPK